MKNRKLIKLALLGLAHGMFLNSHLAAEGLPANSSDSSLKNLFDSPIQKDTALLAAGCGSKCGGSKNNNNNKPQTQVASGCGAKCSTVADRDQPKRPQDPNFAAGCGSKCGGSKNSNNNKPQNPVAAGCGAKCGGGRDNNSKPQNPVAAGCGAKCSSIVAERDVPSGALASPREKNQSSEYRDPNSENMNYRLMSEDELKLELNNEGIKRYDSLTPEGKQLARQVASQMCNGTNECAGLNACQTEKNDCAGKGACKGQSKCAISDKNLAVKLAADKMAKKRADATK